jgi:hypothetical protein
VFIAAITAEVLSCPRARSSRHRVTTSSEADQRDQELYDERDTGEVGQAQRDQECGHDGHRGDQQGQQGQQGPEHERQHGQRPGRADQRFCQHARPLAVAAGLQLRQSGRRRVVARRQHGSQDRQCLLGHQRRAEALRPWREQQRISRPAVSGDERRIAGVPVTDDPELAFRGAELTQGRGDLALVRAGRLPGRDGHGQD